MAEREEMTYHKNAINAVLWQCSHFEWENSIPSENIFIV